MDSSDHITLFHFSTCVSSSQINSGPEKTATFLDVVYIGLSLCIVLSCNLLELQRFCKEEWQKLAKDRCTKLVASNAKRLEAVIDAKGAATKYYVHIIFSFFISNKFANILKNLFSCCHFGVLCVEF